ncbi:MAG TPA: hypothetical protein VGJ36_02950, partial [Gemmatimonadales bacterium]
MRTLPIKFPPHYQAVHRPYHLWLAGVATRTHVRATIAETQIRVNDRRRNLMQNRGGDLNN